MSDHTPSDSREATGLTLTQKVLLVLFFLAFAAWIAIAKPPQFSYPYISKYGFWKIYK